MHGVEAPLSIVLWARVYLLAFLRFVLSLVLNWLSEIEAFPNRAD